jgi:hypothetical protein
MPVVRTWVYSKLPPDLSSFPAGENPSECWLETHVTALTYSLGRVYQNTRMDTIWAFREA